MRIHFEQSHSLPTQLVQGDHAYRCVNRSQDQSCERNDNASRSSNCSSENIIASPHRKLDPSTVLLARRIHTSAVFTHLIFLTYTSKFVGKTIMSRIVTLRGRVNMKMIASETSVGSIRLPLALAFSRFSAGQSASRAETTGPGETWLTLIPWFFNCRRMIWTKLVIAHLELE